MPAETAIDQRVIADAVRGATENVFSTMMDLEVEALEPIDHSPPEAVNGVVALLGFTGPWTGTGMFYCSDHFACRVGSALLMTEVEEVNGEVLDGIGELANMILGNFEGDDRDANRPVGSHGAHGSLRQKLSHPDSGSGQLDHCAL